jgi:2,4-dienoyl-CoA reductase-like NADH-dependent reductase (Old Yellow Enzyme family)/thioredoxin reductase
MTSIHAPLNSNTEPSSKDPLLQPFQLKKLTLKNRVISTSHAISYADNGKPAERYQLYHEEKARGGLALTMFGGASNVAVDSPSIMSQLDVSDDTIIPYFQAFSERIHRHGAALMCQLTHMGRRTTNFGGNWLPSIAPSRSREEMSRSFAREMDRNDIDRIVRCFGDAAWRCKEGGLDGCEVLATGHLVDQFWSKRTNRRGDEFGGSLHNRTLFSRMVLEEIRHRTGDDFIVSLRMVMEENCEDGLSRDDCLQIAQIHQQAGLVDLLGLVHGHLDTYQGLAAYMPGMAAPLAPFLEMAGEFRREIDIPVFHATRISDIATARYAVREVLVDLIGMTRAHLADPHIVRKIEAGEEHRIRPCIGSTYCSTYRQCIHNAATGREATIPHQIEKAAVPGKKVVIVGGGPAGMEAARVCALRGHDVVLIEATNRLGGQVLLAAKASWRADMQGIVDWLAAEIDLLGVTVRTNCYAESEEVLEENPDVIVIASGGLPDIESISGNANVLSTWDVLSGGEQLAGEILVYDGIGKHQATSCVNHLSQQGLEVELVTPDAMVAHDVGKIERPEFMKRFYDANVLLTTDHHLFQLERMGNRIEVKLVNHLINETTTRIVDHVIVEAGTVPNDELYLSLKNDSLNQGHIDVNAMVSGKPQPVYTGDGYHLYTVGDAVSSRDVHTAILDSTRLCARL